DLRSLLVLLLVAAAVRGWLIMHTAVPARDSIGLMRFAWELGHNPDWMAVMRGKVHPPLYPLSILAMSIPVSHLHGGSASEIMQLSAQLASSLAGVLLVVPMFYLGKQLFDR